MKYFAASSASLSFVQMVSTIGTIVGFWFFDFDLTAIAIVALGYFLYSGVGVSMMLHRYWCHKSFEFKSNTIKWLLTWFGIVAGRGSILGWVHVHREHHAFSDTEKDPHAPGIYGWKLYFPFLMNYGKNINRELVRDLYTPLHIRINRYYLLFILSWISILAVIDLRLAYFGWFVPVALTQIMLNSFIYFGHKYGYQDTQSRDRSGNLWFYGLFLWGEGWHNNHHILAKEWNFSKRWWEVDLIAPVIYLLKR